CARGRTFGNYFDYW
nr:immunoglobulin heavy chain junction region [Mus musculus]